MHLVIVIEKKRKNKEYVGLIIDPAVQQREEWDILLQDEEIVEFQFISVTLKLLVLVTIILETFQIIKPIRANAFYRQVKETCKWSSINNN